MAPLIDKRVRIGLWRLRCKQARGRRTSRRESQRRTTVSGLAPLRTNRPLTVLWRCHQARIAFHLISNSWALHLVLISFTRKTETTLSTSWCTQNSEMVMVKQPQIRIILKAQSTKMTSKCTRSRSIGTTKWRVALVASPKKAPTMPPLWLAAFLLANALHFPLLERST